MTKRKKEHLLKNLKNKIVQFHLFGKPRGEIIKEYELTPSAFDKWVR